MFKFIKKIFQKKIYIVNLNSKEIHKSLNPHKNCKTDLISNRIDITKSEYNDYIKNGFNGCKWCNEKDNTG
jgi:hypothetical protein